jgi:hypothetical protein
MVFKLKYLVIISIIFLACPHAHAEIFTAKHVYYVGDNDTKNEARKLCLIEAKRKIVEKAGTYISSKSEVTNMELSLDEITAFSASIIKAKIIDEKWRFNENQMTVELSLEAEVNNEILSNKIQKIGKSKEFLDRLQNQYNKIKLLEKQITDIKMQLNNTDLKEASKLRKRRVEAITEIDSIESRYGEIIKTVENRREIIQKESRELARKIVKYIEIDMTMEEVESLLGKPDTIGSALFDRKLKHYEYRRYRINFSRHGLVEEIEYLTRGSGGGAPCIKEYGYDIFSDGIEEYYKKNSEVVEELKTYVIGTEK